MGMDRKKWRGSKESQPRLGKADVVEEEKEERKKIICSPLNVPCL